MRLQIRVAEMSFLQRELGVEPLLLHIERSQLRWFIWLGCLLVASLWRFSVHIQLGGDSEDAGLYIPSGLGRPRDPPGGAAECRWGEGCPPGPVSSVDRR